jgi:hypothetical protein
MGDNLAEWTEGCVVCTHSWIPISHNSSELSSLSKSHCRVSFKKNDFTQRTFDSGSVDVVLFVGKHFTTTNYLGWCRLFDTLNLKMSVWDQEGYNGISFHR